MGHERIQANLNLTVLRQILDGLSEENDKGVEFETLLYPFETTHGTHRSGISVTQGNANRSPPTLVTEGALHRCRVSGLCVLWPVPKRRTTF